MKKLVLAIVIAAIAAPGLAAPKKKPAPAAAAPQPAKPAAADWRVPDPNNILVIDTNKGRIIVEMSPTVAPNSVQRMRELALEHFFDGLKFFRVIDGFMDQTGDPKNNGTGGSTKPDLEAEFFFRRGLETPFTLAFDATVAEAGFIGAMPVTTQSFMLSAMTKDGKVAGYGNFCQGVVGMARAGDPNSANSQFYIMRDAYPSLERKYTTWGRVIAGQDVVRAIKVGEPVAEPQDFMQRVRLLSDLPEAERPKIRVIDTTKPWFKAQLARIKTEKPGGFSPCDIDIPAEVK